MVWDTTYDGLNYLWLPIPILAALSSSLMLYKALPDGIKAVAPFYFLLIPVLIGVSINAQHTDFHKLTEQRAEQVSMTIEGYYDRKGHYPQDLQALIPWHMILIPGPMVVYGQEWCYDSGNDYYRLGYINREHWSAPHFIGQIYKTKGDVPNLHGMCEQEALAL